MTAKNITSDIRWIMQDNGLDHEPEFKVKTSRKADEFETVIYAVAAQKAVAALMVYLGNTPGSRYKVRDYDGYLAVYQPAKSK